MEQRKIASPVERVECRTYLRKDNKTDCSDYQVIYIYFRFHTKFYQTDADVILVIINADFDLIGRLIRCSISVMYWKTSIMYKSRVSSGSSV
jgi:hypothetical protein